MEQLKAKEGLSKKSLFLFGALGVATFVLLSLPRRMKVIAITNNYNGSVNGGEPCCKTDNMGKGE
ncbi:MAG: hypothetical protein Q8930_19575 [Bacillota bacterium]|nr:hypothetical protein [Bacillota bacterium]